MSKWQEDPELFMYKEHGKDNAVRIWRCKRMSSSMPLNRNDFADETPVRSKLSVLKSFGRSQPNPLETLEKYISPMHFLVNCQGSVYVELHKFNQDGKIDTKPPTYVRLLDVLNMEAFDLAAVPKVPIRKLGYLNSIMTAKACPNPNEMKLAADAEALQQELKVTAEKLNEKTKEITNLQVEQDKVMNIREDVKTKVAQLEAELKEFRKANEKETWMNECKIGSDWVNLKGLRAKFNTHGYTMKVLPLTRTTSSDTSTNVNESKFYQTFISEGNPYCATVVNVNDLTNGEKAKFSPDVWGTMENDNITYAAKFT